MTGPLLLLFALLLIALAVRLIQYARHTRGTDRILERLGEGQPLPQTPSRSWDGLERMFVRAGLGKPKENLGIWLSMWVLGMVTGFVLAGWAGLLTLVVLPPLMLRLYIAWLYQRRLARMIEQLPQLLDHTVRSLKSGRTLADAVLGAIDVSEDPLKRAMGRVQRNVQLGVSLPDAAQDFAEFYEQDELRLFALGLKVNHRYGGNASELLENLIKMIREREQGTRQLKAMTGETRMTAYVLAGLPVAMVAYFLVVNPDYLITMWNDSNGRYMLFIALAMDLAGSYIMLRMLRSV